MELAKSEFENFDNTLEHNSSSTIEVLVVEDNPNHTLIINLILAACGYRATCFKDSQKAYSYAVQRWKRGTAFDMILLDIGLPQLSGLEFVRGLRDLGYPSPVITMTARGLEYDKTVANDAGSDDHLDKLKLTTSLPKVLGKYLEI